MGEGPWPDVPLWIRHWEDLLYGDDDDDDDDGHGHDDDDDNDHRRRLWGTARARAPNN